MGRRPRNDITGGIHHVMNRGVDHQRIFFGDPDRVEFGERLAAIHERFAVEILAYCLMDNHYHLLLRAPDGGLSAAMQHLGLTYTRHTNDRVGRDGPLFRGRFNSILVTTDAYLLRATRYIHRNPLDIVDVRTPRGYRWSSYRAYLGLRRRPPFLATDMILGLVGNDRQALARSTEAAMNGPAVSELDDLLQHVRFAVAHDDLVHGSDEASPRRIERAVLVLIAHEVAGTPLGDRLERLLDFPSDAARRMALRRARGRSDELPVARIVGEVLAVVDDAGAA